MNSQFGPFLNTQFDPIFQLFSPIPLLLNKTIRPNHFLNSLKQQPNSKPDLPVVLYSSSRVNHRNDAARATIPPKKTESRGDASPHPIFCRFQLLATRPYNSCRSDSFESSLLAWMGARSITSMNETNQGRPSPGSSEF